MTTTSAPLELATRSRQMQLASLLASYPSDGLGAALEDLVEDLGVERSGSAAVVRRSLEAAGALDELRSRYLHLFETGKGHASLYETEHGRMRGMSKGNDLADIAGFYSAFGLKLDDDPANAEAQKEMLDHVAVELEFYSMLLLKQALVSESGDREGVFVVEDARKKFLADHLGRFLAAIAARPEVAADPTYGDVFRWCRDLVAKECDALGVTPAPLDFFGSGDDPDPTACGDARALPIVRDSL